MLWWWRNWGWFGKGRREQMGRGSARPYARRSRSRIRSACRTVLRVEQLEDRTTPTNNIPLHPVNWTSLGPVAINPGGNTLNPWSGPIASVAASGSTWYVATVGGGIWKSADAGATWTPLTDFLASSLYTTPGAPPLQNVSLSFGMIAVSPTNPNFVMVQHRSLQDLAQRFAYSTHLDYTIYNAPTGLGWLISTDGGQTWFVTDGDNVPDGSGGFDTNLSNGPFVGATMDKIVFSPFNPNTIYAAVTNAPNSGLYRSTDGGRTWQNLTASKIQDSQGNFTSGGRRFSDVVLHPTDPNHLWVAIGDPGGHELNGLWESKDGGNTWNRAPNFPSGRFEPRTGYIRVAIAPSDSNVMYAIVRDAVSAGATYRFMASVDGGNWWAPVNASGMAGLTGPGPGTFVNPVRLVVDANDKATVYYTMGTSIARATFSPMPPPFNDPTQFSVFSTLLSSNPPSDFAMTDLVTDPAGGFLVTTEGGIWRFNATTNQFESRNTGLQIALVNSVGHSLLTDSLMYAGTRFTGLLRYDDNDNLPDWFGANTSPNTVGRVLADQLDSNWVYWLDFNGINNTGNFFVRFSSNQGASSTSVTFSVSGSTFAGNVALSGGDIMRPQQAPPQPSPSPPAGAPTPLTPFTGQQVRHYFPPMEMDPDFSRIVLATNAAWEIGALRSAPTASQLGDIEVVFWQYWDDTNNNNQIDAGAVIPPLFPFTTVLTFFTTFASVPITTIHYERHGSGPWIPSPQPRRLRRLSTRTTGGATRTSWNRYRQRPWRCLPMRPVRRSAFG